ncbi:MAG: hypothetical protein HN737_11085 [Desulfobacterales bacterium]|nr:hypothetical protein [Desulfobacteraceae bacterium]MBT7697940.1 hypothetical protein [Desulfobacterales bacterium]
MKKILVSVFLSLFLFNTLGLGQSQALTQEKIQTLMGLKASVYGGLAYEQAQLSKAGKADPSMLFGVTATPPFLYFNFIVPDEKAKALSREIGMPHGLSLSKIQLTNDGDSHYYITVNIYLATGLAAGYRAEWSTYITQDNDPDSIPRFMVVEARSSSPTYSSVDFEAPPTRVDYTIKKNIVKTFVDSDKETTFSASFTLPEDPFMETISREWVESNDKIFWTSGVNDKAYYDATLANSDMISIYNGDVTIKDTTRWSKYVDPTPDTVLLSTGPVDLVVSPWHNVKDGNLTHIDPDLLQILNSNKRKRFGGLASLLAGKVKKGVHEPVFEFYTQTDVPSLYINFRVPKSRRAALAKAIPLPPGFEFAKVRFIENTTRYGNNLHPLGHLRSKRPEYMISLNIYHAAGVSTGYRAEWATFVKRTDIDDDTPRYMILEALSSTQSFDPVTALIDPENPMRPPASTFKYNVIDNIANISIMDSGSSFKAAIPLPGSSTAFKAKSALNWVEAKDYTYWKNGICDRYFCNATLGNADLTIVTPVPVVDKTQWSQFVDPVPFQILSIPEKLEFMILPWNNLNELKGSK